VPHYFLLHDPSFLESAIFPAFSRSWQERSFEPVAELSVRLREGMASFKERFCLSDQKPVLAQLAEGVRFDRAVWEMAFGEALFFGARGAPDAPVSFYSLRYLLGSAGSDAPLTSRSDWPWIERAVLGSRSFRLGRGVYRPTDAGWNPEVESASILAELQDVDAAGWSIEKLHELDASWDDEDLEDELALASQAVAGLRQIYAGACRNHLAIVCEYIA
jgi:hypothetical protein